MLSGREGLAETTLSHSEGLRVDLTPQCPAAQAEERTCKGPEADLRQVLVWVDFMSSVAL